MKAGWRAAVFLILAGIVAAAVVFWRYGERTIETVTVVEASIGSIEQVITATGSVEAKRKVLVTADPGARIAALYFDELDIVSKGQVLAKLDDIELVTQLRQLEVARNLAKANLAEAQSRLEQSRSLHEKGYVARQDVETVERQVDLYRSQVDEKQAAIQLVKAKLERISIRAPIDGAITRKLVEVGGVVSDGSHGVGASLGGQLQPMVIAEIAHLEALEFHVEVDQIDIGLVRRGQHAIIVLDAFPDRRFTGTVTEVTLSNIEEMGGRVRYKVRVELQKSDAPLRLGMTGTVNFLLARKENIVTLPTSVLTQRGGEEFVFAVEDGKAHLKSIQTGLRTEDVVEVVSGLSVGARVVDQGRARMKDRLPVEVTGERKFSQ
jgi:RND family efflux transporter MFP subunit